MELGKDYRTDLDPGRNAQEFNKAYATLSLNQRILYDV